jgi:hypothetical protein
LNPAPALAVATGSLNGDMSAGQRSFHLLDNSGWNAAAFLIGAGLGSAMVGYTQELGKAKQALVIRGPSLLICLAFF